MGPTVRLLSGRETPPHPTSTTITFWGVTAAVKNAPLQRWQFFSRPNFGHDTSLWFILHHCNIKWWIKSGSLKANVTNVPPAGGARLLVCLTESPLTQSGGALLSPSSLPFNQPTWVSMVYANFRMNPKDNYECTLKIQLCTKWHNET